MQRHSRLLASSLTATVLAAGALVAAPTAEARPANADAYKMVYVYATDVHLREAPRTNATIVDSVSHVYLRDYCQTNRNTTPVADPNGGTNPWWSRVTLASGSDFAYVSNVFLRGGRKISGVPDC